MRWWRGILNVDQVLMIKKTLDKESGHILVSSYENLALVAIWAVVEVKNILRKVISGQSCYKNNSVADELWRN